MASKITLIDFVNGLLRACWAGGSDASGQLKQTALGRTDGGAPRHLYFVPADTIL
jgi:hypothetical protein